MGASTLTLKISDRGRIVPGAGVALEADMSHPGMQPQFGRATEIGPGNYQGRLSFTMAGDWVILMHIKLSGGRQIDRQIEVKNVRAN